MVAIPFPVQSLPGSRPAEGQGVLINAYATREGDAVVIRRTPGLVKWGTSAQATPRGMLPVGSDLFVAYTDKVVRFGTAGGVGTLLTGDLSGSGPVTIAQNNKQPTPDIAAVGDGVAYVLTTASVSAYPDVDVGAPNSVAFLDGFFLFTYGDGRIIASDLNSTAINTSSVAKAEAKPDGLLRGAVSGQLFYAFGPSSTEVWQNVGTSPFPLARVAVIPVGLAAAGAVTGSEDGWDTGLIFVAADNTVRRMDGYNPVIISTPDVERDIVALADKGALRATVYIAGGLAIWALSCPEWTWEYNVSAELWHERKSYGAERWRGQASASFAGKWLVGDMLSGNLHEVLSSAHTEDEQPLVFHVESAPVKRFPAQIVCRRADFDFVVGQGLSSGADPIERDPQVMVSWSDDGGAKWSVPVLRELGGEGETRRMVTVLNTGQATAHGRRWRLQISDPVYVALLGGDMNAKARIT